MVNIYIYIHINMGYHGILGSKSPYFFLLNEKLDEFPVL